MTSTPDNALALDPESSLRRHRAELTRAIQDFKEAALARLNFGPRLARQRWRLLPGGIALGLLIAIRRRARNRALEATRMSASPFTNRSIDKMKNLRRRISMGDILGAFGVRRRPSTFDSIATAIGLVGTGLVIGAGLGLLFAPRAGRDTRLQIAEHARRLRERGTNVGRRNNGVGQRPGDGDYDDIIDPSNV